MADYRHLVTWTSVDFTQIGSTNFRSTGTLSFEIPALIPDDAIEVLLYAYFHAHNSGGTTSHFKIYTEEDDGKEYAKYIRNSDHRQSQLLLRQHRQLVVSNDQ